MTLSQAHTADHDLDAQGIEGEAAVKAEMGRLRVHQPL